MLFYMIIIKTYVEQIQYVKNKKEKRIQKKEYRKKNTEKKYRKILTIS